MCLRYQGPHGRYPHGSKTEKRLPHDHEKRRADGVRRGKYIQLDNPAITKRISISQLKYAEMAASQ